MSDSYLVALRGVIDDYEAEMAAVTAAARDRLQTRLRQLLDEERAVANEEPVSGPADPASRRADEISPAGEATVPSVLPSPAASSQPLACATCERTFPNEHALRVHRGRAHRAKHGRRPIEPPQESTPGQLPGDAGSATGPTPPAAIEAPAQEPAAVLPPRPSAPPAPATDSPGQVPRDQRSAERRSPSVGSPAPASTEPDTDVGICPRCDRQQFHLSAHIPTCSGSTSSPASKHTYLCGRCTEKFETREALAAHNRAGHPPDSVGLKPLGQAPRRIEDGVPGVRLA